MAKNVIVRNENFVIRATRNGHMVIAVSAEYAARNLFKNNEEVAVCNRYNFRKGCEEEVAVMGGLEFSFQIADYLQMRELVDNNQVLRKCAKKIEISVQVRAPEEQPEPLELFQAGLSIVDMDSITNNFFAPIVTFSKVDDDNNIYTIDIPMPRGFIHQPRKWCEENGIEIKL